MTFQIAPGDLTIELPVTINVPAAAVNALGEPVPDGFGTAVGRLPAAIAAAVADVFAGAGVPLEDAEGATIAVSNGAGAVTFTGSE